MADATNDTNDTPDYGRQSLELHARLRGKIGIAPKFEVRTTDDLSIAYTPGVARPCEVIAADVSRSFDLTVRGNAVAIVTDGSAVLGLGDIGPAAAMPVMEGKALLFKAYADVDAWPICLDCRDADAIVETVRRLAPGFGGINLEDIAAPRCFHVEDALQDLGIPVMHDDQHGTAIVVVAGLLNAMKVVGRELRDARVVINGAGAAGLAIARLLRCIDQDPDVCVPVRDVVLCDSKGAIHAGRDDLSAVKRSALPFTNREDRRGPLTDVLAGADVFIGVSVGHVLDEPNVRSMASDPIVLALANPTPEIEPDRALAAGAAVVGTGRSDHPNQVNNVLAFPGIFRGALDVRASRLDATMKIAAAHALAGVVEAPTADRILPSPLDPAVAPAVARAVAEAARRSMAAD